MNFSHPKHWPRLVLQSVRTSVNFSSKLVSLLALWYDTSERVLGSCPRSLSPQVRLVSVKAERPNHPSRGGGGVSQPGGGQPAGGGGPPPPPPPSTPTTTTTMTQMRLHKADSTYSRARPNNTEKGRESQNRLDVFSAYGIPTHLCRPCRWA